MPTQLSERPEELVRQFLVDNINPANIEGYDPQETDTQASEFLPVTSDWSKRGDYWPIIVVRQDSDPTVPGGGNTNYNSLQGDGSGPNQFSITPITFSAQAVQGGEIGGVFRNSTTAEEITFELYQEAHRLIQQNATEAIDEATTVGMTPPTVTRSNTEADGGSTTTWIQHQGTIQFGFIDTP